MQKDAIKDGVLAVMRSHPLSDRIANVALFGSRLEGTEKPDSDVDLLVTFRKPIGYFGLANLEGALSEVIGLQVHLSTSESLSKYFREDVIRSAETLYEG